MKNIKFALIAGLLGASLVGCTNIQLPTGETGGNTTGGGTESGGNTGGGTQGGGTGSLTGIFKRVNVPNKVKATGTVAGVSKPYTIYRIDNEFMCVHNNEINYGIYNSTKDTVTSYYGEISGGKVTWEADTVTLDKKNQFFFDLQFMLEYEDTRSYMSKYCKATSDKKDICGHHCVKWTESMSNFEYWAEESTNLVFQENIDSLISEITDYTTDVSALPYAAPTK